MRNYAFPLNGGSIRFYLGADIIEEYKKVDFDEVIEKIGLGIIRRWNYSQFIDINTYIKNKNKSSAVLLRKWMIRSIVSLPSERG